MEFGVVKPANNSNDSGPEQGRDDFARFFSVVVEAVRAAGYMPGRGLTVSEVAARYRISKDKVRADIKAGRLLAINTATARCGKPRYIVLPEALAEFEKARSTAPLPKVPRRRQPKNQIDYFPDGEAA